jgi:hypothetical protein
MFDSLWIFASLAHIEGFLGVIFQRPIELNVCAKSMFISSPYDLQQCYPGDHARMMSTLQINNP